jgi:nicotinamidase-related amidase
MPEATARIFEMISAENCCALLVDHQPGLYLGAGDITLLALRNNSIALAKVLRLHNIPTVSCEAQGAAGPMGPLLPEIAAVFPDVEPIYRTKINSWQDPKIRSAIEATGRKKVVCAGITADFCIGLPAKSMAAEGYDVRLVIDASGNDSPIALQFAIANLTQHGVQIHGWISVACELQNDWAHQQTAEGLLKI